MDIIKEYKQRKSFSQVQHFDVPSKNSQNRLSDRGYTFTTVNATQRQNISDILNATSNLEVNDFNSSEYQKKKIKIEQKQTQKESQNQIQKHENKDKDKDKDKDKEIHQIKHKRKRHLCKVDQVKFDEYHLEECRDENIRSIVKNLEQKIQQIFKNSIRIQQNSLSLLILYKDDLTIASSLNLDINSIIFRKLQYLILKEVKKFWSSLFKINKQFVIKFWKKSHKRNQMISSVLFSIINESGVKV